MEFFLAPDMAPFTFFATLVIGFLVLEVVFAMIGIDTHLGDMEADIGSWEAGVAAGDVSPLLDGLSLPEGVEIEALNKPSVSSSGGILDILGIRKVSLTIWLALFSASFAAVGIMGQSVVQAFFGAMLPSTLAVAVAIMPALSFTKLFAGIVGRLLPQMETTAISERSFGRRRGVVTVGVARRGMPAEVRFTDAYGNLHYIRAEPFEDAAEIVQGQEVLIIRVRLAGNTEPLFRLIPMS